MIGWEQDSCHISVCGHGSYLLYKSVVLGNILDLVQKIIQQTI